MTIQNRRQLENTRKKLQLLEGELRELESEPVTNPLVRELTKRSLKKLINRMLEAIARFEAHASFRS